MYLNLTHDNIGVLSKELKFGVPTTLFLSDFLKTKTRVSLVLAHSHVVLI